MLSTALEPPGAVRERPDEEIEQFIDQARWLIDYHDRRGESLATRAVALLGFSGVMLALILRWELPVGVSPSRAVVVALVSTVVLLMGTAGACLRTLWPRDLKAPAIRQLRRNWRAWVTSQRRGSAAKDIAEGFLLAKSLDEACALELTLDAANSRAVSFKWAGVLMLLAMASLGLLLVVIGIQIVR
ncbi:hypothetical protein GCM10028815_34700 [Mariniluteicoccus flavus]